MHQSHFETSTLLNRSLESRNTAVTVKIINVYFARLATNSVIRFPFYDPVLLIF